MSFSKIFATRGTFQKSLFCVSKVSDPFQNSAAKHDVAIEMAKHGEIEEAITNNKPAAVESAAAIAPAATRPTTQIGSWAISGFANTRMSLFTVNSLPFQPLSAAFSANCGVWLYS